MINLENKFHAVSFDVFDTVVTRITAHPRAVFLLIQEELERSEDSLPTCLVDNFHTTRIEAERTARKLSSTEDVTIEEIYDVIKKKYDLAQECIERLISLEIRVESRAIRVVPETVRFITDLRNSGTRIIFVSDMYLPVDVLEGILRKKGVFKEGDGLYVSGHMGLAKRTGNLFKKVLHLERLHASELHHLGDNRRSDYVKALKSGIASMHLDRGCLNRYERILALSDTEDSLWLQRQLLAGASRLARLQCVDDYHDKNLRTLHTIGANIAGPILFGFVYWVLLEASKQGARKIYFLARDGQIFHKIAQRIAPLVDDSIELRYLYASRQAWHLPSVVKMTERDIAWITKKAPYLTLRRIALRLEIEPGILGKYFEKYGLLISDIDYCFSDKEIEELSGILQNDENLKEIIINKASGLRDNLTKYLYQEEVFSDSKVFIVDCGWHGTMQVSLERLVAAVDNNVEVIGYYFGLLGGVEPSLNKRAYLFSSAHPREYRSFTRFICHLFEVFTSADHGMTVRYTNDAAHKVSPVLKNDVGSFVNDGRLDSLRKGIFDFIDGLLDAKDIYPQLLNGLDSRENLLALLKEFYLSPQPEQAEALGGLEYAADQFEVDLQPFAPVINLRDTLYYIKYVRSRERYFVTKWIHGSAIRSSRMVRWLVYLATQFILKKNVLSFKIRSQIKSLRGNR